MSALNIPLMISMGNWDIKKMKYTKDNITKVKKRCFNYNKTYKIFENIFAKY